LVIGFALPMALVNAAWPASPASIGSGLLGGALVFILTALICAVVLLAATQVLALLPRFAGMAPLIGGGLFGLVGVLTGALLSGLTVILVGVTLVAAGFVTLQLAAGAPMSDKLIDDLQRIFADRTSLIQCVIAQVIALLMFSGVLFALLYGFTKMVVSNPNSEAMTTLIEGLAYLFGAGKIGLAVISTGDTVLTTEAMIAASMFVVAFIFVAGVALAPGLAVSARALRFYLPVRDADFRMPMKQSIPDHMVFDLPPSASRPTTQSIDPTLDIERPAGWDPDQGAASSSKRLQISLSDSDDDPLQMLDLQKTFRKGEADD
jgi:hypothetical protein